MPKPSRSEARVGERDSAVLRGVLQDHNVIIPGCFDVPSAIEAARAGARCLFLSGGSAARSVFGDTTIRPSHQDDYVSIAARICAVSPIPVIVDAEDGFGSPVEVARRFETVGAAGVVVGDSDEDRVHPREYLVDALGELRDRELVVVARSDVLDKGVLHAKARLDDYLGAGADYVMPLLTSVPDEISTSELAELIESLAAGSENRTIVHGRERAQLPSPFPEGVAAYLVTRELLDAARAGVRSVLRGLMT